jgi:hypothetical protein
MANDPRNQDQERITDEDVVGRVADDEEEFDDEDQLDEDDQEQGEGADEL